MWFYSVLKHPRKRKKYSYFSRFSELKFFLNLEDKWIYHFTTVFRKSHEDPRSNFDSTTNWLFEQEQVILLSGASFSSSIKQTVGIEVLSNIFSGEVIDSEILHTTPISNADKDNYRG